jgi:hypothetical protein
MKFMALFGRRKPLISNREAGSGKDRKITFTGNNACHSEHLNEKLCESSNLADVAFSAQFVTYDGNPPGSS